jgi:hypothetical protein
MSRLLVAMLPHIDRGAKGRRRLDLLPDLGNNPLERCLGVSHCECVV